MVKSYANMRDVIITGEEPDPVLSDLIYQIPHRPYRDGFLLNQLKDFPDNQEEISTTQDSAGPTFARNYFGLITDETMEYE
jgi:hypothetical protein